MSFQLPGEDGRPVRKSGGSSLFSGGRVAALILGLVLLAVSIFLLLTTHPARTASTDFFDTLPDTGRYILLMAGLIVVGLALFGRRKNR